MPDPEGRITDKEQEQVRLWFQSRQKGLQRCEFCDMTDTWVISERVGAMQFVNAKPSLSPHQPIYAFISVYCKNCGYTHFFNSTIMEVTPKAPPDQQQGKVTSGN